MIPAETLSTVILRGQPAGIPRFEINVVAGPDRGARTVASSEELIIGTARDADLRLTDGAVSDRHCLVRVTARGLELRDLESTNGTFLGEHEIARAYLREGTRIRAGTTILAVAILDAQQPLGRMIGTSAPMQRMHAMIEQYAQSAGAVLIRGEIGTGKALVAEALHAAGPRRDRPFVIVDCSALPRQLGSVPGAFTEANEGTLFLDDVGELPLELQALVVRALEHRRIDVRLIAASDGDLRAKVNARRFRADLFYRLDVLRILVPPLRERENDIALLAARFWRALRGDEIPPSLLAELAGQSWPGNVRELRNAVEHAALAGWKIPPGTPPSFAQAKEHAMRQWEKTWLEGLLATHAHNLTQAARTAQLGRSYLRQLCQRHGLRPICEEDGYREVAVAGAGGSGAHRRR